MSPQPAAAAGGVSEVAVGRARKAGYAQPSEPSNRAAAMTAAICRPVVWVSGIADNAVARR
jgi:hypothetical protein